MSYSNGNTANYQFMATAIDTAGVLGRIYGPSGKQGRLVDVSVHLTAATTVAASELIIGKATDTDAYGTLAIPVQAINTGVNGVTHGDDDVIPADTVLLITTDGGSTAGDGDINVLIEWY